MLLEANVTAADSWVATRISRDQTEGVVMSKRYKEIGSWALLPKPKTKQTPDFIPETLREAYYQACVIADISPRAAAALARYCLQRMIRDFWKIPEAQFGNLAAEFDFISARIPPESKSSIDLVRTFGDIDKYLREHVDKMIDADPMEVELLIRLNEILFDDWYVARHNRERRSAELQDFIATLDHQRPMQLETLTALPPKGEAITNVKQSVTGG